MILKTDCAGFFYLKPQPQEHTDMRQQNIPIDPNTFAWYADNFQSARQAMASTIETVKHDLENHPAASLFPDQIQAMAFMIQSWRYIYRNALGQLRGMFTANELKLLVDIHNGHQVGPATYGAGLLCSAVSDAIALDAADEKWEIDPVQIAEKCRSLTNVLAMTMELWAAGYWAGNGTVSRDLEAYVKQLA
jgi:hypothetical protein